MEKIYRVGTRTSPLALKQVEEILGVLRRFYPDIRAEISGFSPSNSSGTSFAKRSPIAGRNDNGPSFQNKKNYLKF